VGADVPTHAVMRRSPTVEVDQSFEYVCDVTKAWTTADGRRWFRGVASGIAEDRAGERVSKDCIADMAKQAIAPGGLAITSGHEQDWLSTCGTVEKLQHDPEHNELLYEASLPAEGEDPIADKAWKLMRSGRKLGISIGGKLRKAYYELVDGPVVRKRKVLDRIELRHLMLTEKPAYPHTFAEVVAKTFDTAAPADDAFVDEDLAKAAPPADEDPKAPEAPEADAGQPGADEPPAGQGDTSDTDDAKELPMARHLCCPACGHEFAAPMPKTGPDGTDDAVTDPDDNDEDDGDARKSDTEDPMDLTPTVASLRALADRDDVTKTDVEAAKADDVTKTEPSDLEKLIAASHVANQGAIARLAEQTNEALGSVAKALQGLVDRPQGRRSVGRVVDPPALDAEGAPAMAGFINPTAFDLPDVAKAVDTTETRPAAPGPRGRHHQGRHEGHAAAQALVARAGQRPHARVHAAHVARLADESFYADGALPQDGNTRYLRKGKQIKCLGEVGRVTGLMIAGGRNFADQLALEQTARMTSVLQAEERRAALRRLDQVGVRSSPTATAPVGAVPAVRRHGPHHPPGGRHRRRRLDLRRRLQAVDPAAQHDPAGDLRRQRRADGDRGRPRARSGSSTSCCRASSASTATASCTSSVSSACRSCTTTRTSARCRSSRRATSSPDGSQQTKMYVYCEKTQAENIIEVAELQELGSQPLAKIDDSERFMVNEYETLVNRAPQWSAIGEVASNLAQQSGHADSQLVFWGCTLSQGTTTTKFNLAAGEVSLAQAMVSIAAVVDTSVPAGAATGAGEFRKVLVEVDGAGAVSTVVGDKVTTAQTDAVLPAGNAAKISVGYLEIPASFTPGTTVVTNGMCKAVAYSGA
jgi:hypothetical protein